MRGEALLNAEDVRASWSPSDSDIASMLTWNTDQVCTWLRGVGLGAFEKQFQAHQITGDVLPLLAITELKGACSNARTACVACSHAHTA